MAYSDIDHIKDALGRDPVRVLDALGVDTRPAGAYVFVQPPYASNSSSLWVALHDGSWKDEIGGQDIDRGDIIDLIRRIRRDSFVDAKKWALGFLGWGEIQAYKPPSPEALAKLDADKARRLAEHQAVRDRKSSGLFWYWLHKLPPAQGTIIETYMREVRELPLDRLKGHSKTGFPHSLRFEARSEHTDEDTGEVTYWPAQVGLYMRGRDGVALHREWLLPDGRGKAPVSGNKKSFGAYAGATIRLWHGAGDLRPSEALARGVKLTGAVGEGIATCLAVACAAPELRVEAAGALSNIGNFEWPDYYGDLILLKENDAKPAAVKAFERALEKANARPAAGDLYTHAPDQGDDHNSFIKLDPRNIDILAAQLRALKDY